MASFYILTTAISLEVILIPSFRHTMRAYCIREWAYLRTLQSVRLLQGVRLVYFRL